MQASSRGLLLREDRGGAESDCSFTNKGKKKKGEVAKIDVVVEPPLAAQRWERVWIPKARDGMKAI